LKNGLEFDEMAEKEPLMQSGRFRLFVSGIILEVLAAVAPQLGLQISDELLQTVAAGVAGLVAVMIYSRGQRNTAG
jgi:hypothetical protein